MDGWQCVNENAKLYQKGSCGGHVAHFLMLGLPNISGTIEPKNFKFRTEMDHGGEY